MTRLLLLILISLAAAAWLPAQSDAERKEAAKNYIRFEKYDAALRTLTAGRQAERLDEEGRFLAAVCYYQLNQLGPAQQLLEQLIGQEKSPYPECWWYLGKVLHAQHQFTAASRNFKLYLRTLRPEQPARAMVIEEIRRCDNGLRQQYREPRAVVENMGPAINGPGDEFAPVLSPSYATRLYFSARRAGNTGGARNAQGQPDEQYGHYTSDMFNSRLEGGVWTRAEPLHYLLNGAQHEVLLDFAAGGQALLYYQSSNLEAGDILIDTFQRERKNLRTNPFLSPMNARQGDRAPFLYNDTLLLFASRRAGGYGGLDLWRTRLRDGRWTPPENLGPQINSAFDETTPFLARDGRTLYFSSNDSRRGIGGLDILMSVYLPEAARWSEPDNLGIPINSAGDDSFFRLAVDGFTGFFASNRKDGMGERDIYVAYFTTYRQEMEPPATAYLPIPERTTAPGPATNYPPVADEQPYQPEVTPAPRTPPASRDRSLRWQGRELYLTEADRAKVDESVRQLLQYPELRLVISVYAPGRQPQELDLAAGIRYAEQIGKLVQQGGVAADRLFLRAIRAPQSGGDWLANLTFTGVAATPLAGQLPVVGQAEGLYAQAPINRELLYKVQFVSSKSAEFQHKQLAQLEHLMVETTLDFPYYRFTAGALPTFAEAKRYRQRVADLGFTRPFIVAYLYGERIDHVRAKRQLHLFPDLENYLAE